MASTKRKVSVSLDEDLVAELEAGGEALSVQVNEAVRVVLTRRRRLGIVGTIFDEIIEAMTQAGSADLADAHFMAAAIEADGRVIVSGDPADLERLAAAYRNGQVSAI